ncbi:hypothetical protein EV697_10816 [Bisgaardia hudsonensis]|uniref:Uncharacterized protein n=2 Tax=Bisgaardia hudsonensis TaxID=109472 RepID=A0A4V2SIU8_9PAST|nr:hypothetical protein [Bisgaardia hudsonensis]QLB12879.1 hypothetical protein A6A11_04280 [Bisgaardia hudsonensis]TCP11293.1 hypothetical protein EV697_10816 [Bisgaardia hudsonensis]
MSGQVTVGYGVSGSASYSQSKVNADYASVSTQAGVFTGDDGFKVNVKKHTNLKGGLITSIEKAEADNKNRFSTGTLSHSDIQNHSSSAKGFGLSGGFSVSGGNAPKEVEGVKLKPVGENHSDGNSKVEIQGIAGIGNQGNWGIAKGLATALLGQMSDKGSENGVTTSRINTSNIKITDSSAQEKLTGQATSQLIDTLNQRNQNQNQSVSKVDIQAIKEDLSRDLDIAQSFINNVSQTGDDIYYKMEKNEDSSFTTSKERADCEHISCLKVNDPLVLKKVIYSDKVLTREQAELLSKTATAGMLNLTREDKISSAILYEKELKSLDELGVVLNRGSAGVVNEFIFTGFERLRAWANKPAIFGASNATRDTVQIWKKLDEYNAYAKTYGDPVYNSHNLSHSLGVSGNKNALNWSEHLGQKYENTKVDFLHLGGSYPSKDIHNQAKPFFKDVKTQYSCVSGDVVCQGIPILRGVGLGMIGNNPTTADGKGINFLQAHSEANFNRNNLNYGFDKNDEDRFLHNYNNAIDILNKVYGEGGNCNIKNIEEETVK